MVMIGVESLPDGAKVNWVLDDVEVVGYIELLGVDWLVENL